MDDYFWCSSVGVYHKDSITSANMNSCTKRLLIFLADLNWLQLNRFSPPPVYSLSILLECNQWRHQTRPYKEKLRTVWEQEHSFVSLQSQPHMVPRVLFKLNDAFILVYKADMSLTKWSGHLVSVGCSITFSCSLLKAFVKSTNMLRGIFSSMHFS